MVDGVEDFEIDVRVVVFFRDYINIRKATGLDNICGQLLKLCASHLSVVFSHLFSWPLKEDTVPFTWKTSVICPVPKKQTESLLV